MLTILKLKLINTWAVSKDRLFWALLRLFGSWGGLLLLESIAEFGVILVIEIREAIIIYSIYWIIWYTKQKKNSVFKFKFHVKKVNKKIHIKYSF